MSKHPKVRRRKSTGPKLPRSVKRLFPHVREIVDSKQRVEVQVTAKDSANGKRLKATECALAVAAKRDFQADGVIIGLSRSYIIKGKKAIRFATPAHIAREIVSFDRHQDFAPGTYELIPVTPTARLGYKDPDRSHGSPERPRQVHRGTARVRILDVGTEQ